MLTRPRIRYRARCARCSFYRKAFYVVFKSASGVKATNGPYCAPCLVLVVERAAKAERQLGGERS